MSRDVPRRVRFDEEVEVAGVDIAGDWGVGADDFLVADDFGFGVFDVEVGAEGDVLADGQAEDAVGAGQGEAVDGCVVREDCFFG